MVENKQLWTPYPKSVVQIGKTTLEWADIIEWEMNTNVSWDADSLTLTLDNSNMISDFIRKEMVIRVWAGRVVDPDYWTKGDLTKIFHGKIDGILPRFSKGIPTVQIQARDLTREMIDVEISETITGFTASDVVKMFADRHGLPTVMRPTVREIDAEAFEKSTEWEAIQRLAIREGYVAFVTRTPALWFVPRDDRALREENDQLIGAWYYKTEPFSILDMSMDDSSVGIANRIRVVRWLGKEEGYVSGVADSRSRIKAMGGRVIERVVYSKSAKNEADCITEATAILAEKSRDVITGRVTLEGDPELRGDRRIRLAGKIGRFAGDYYINEATHNFSKANGYVVTCDVTNTRPEASEVYRDFDKPDETAEELAASTSLVPCGSGGPDKGMVRDLLAYARRIEKQGVRYEYGGTTVIENSDGSFSFPDGGIDCSAFVQACFRSLGIEIGRSTGVQNVDKNGPVVDIPMAGDIVHFKNKNPSMSPAYDHIGIVIEDTTKHIHCTASEFYGDPDTNGVHETPIADLASGYYITYRRIAALGENEDCLEGFATSGSGVSISGVTREDKPSSQVIGSFSSPPKGIILHGSRGCSGDPCIPVAQELQYGSCVNSAINRQDGIGWNATIGDNKYAVHIDARKWSYNAGVTSEEYLGVEFAQDTETREISDAQVRAFCAWFINDVKPHWPDMVLSESNMPMHSQVPQGIADGKTDVYARGDTTRERRLKRRILDMLSSGEFTRNNQPTTTSDAIHQGTSADIDSYGGKYWNGNTPEGKQTMPSDLKRAIARRFPRSEWETAARITWRESRWNTQTAVDTTKYTGGKCGVLLPYEHQPLRNGNPPRTDVKSEISVGAWQINICVHTYQYEDMLDVEANTQAAYQLYQEAIRIWGDGWHPWRGQNIPE